MDANIVKADTGGKVFSLTHAILLYCTGAGDGYVSLHDIQQLGKRPVLGPGTPATTAGLREMMWTLAPETRPQPEFIPESVLCQGPSYLVWWVKPSHRNLWFKCKELGGGVSGKVSLPGLVFVVMAGKWFVFAVKGKTRPTPETVLYRSPFLNVWAGGEICTGTAVIPDGAQASMTAAWEDAFFHSRFSHTNVHAPEHLVKYKDGCYMFWSDMLAGKFSSFPERVLIQERHSSTPKSGVRLGDLIFGVSSSIGGRI